MLHHPWMRAFQRRPSVMVPSVIQRKASGAVGAALPEIGGEYKDMTPAEIEEVISRLQAAQAQHAYAAQAAQAEDHDQDIAAVHGLKPVPMLTPSPDPPCPPPRQSQQRPPATDYI